MMKRPNLGFSYLLVEGIDVDQWCKKYELRPFKIVCSKCGEIRDVKHPFVAKEHNRRGLLAEDCSCGTSSFTFVSDELQKLMEPLPDYEPTVYQDHSGERCQNCNFYEGPDIGEGFCNDPDVKEPTPANGHCEDWRSK